MPAPALSLAAGEPQVDEPEIAWCARGLNTTGPADLAGHPVAAGRRDQAIVVPSQRTETGGEDHGAQGDGSERRDEHP